MIWHLALQLADGTSCSKLIINSLPRLRLIITIAPSRCELATSLPRNMSVLRQQEEAKRLTLLCDFILQKT